MAEPKNWIITASGERSLEEVKRELADFGFEVHEVYEQIGAFMGSATDEVAERIRATPGIIDISEPPSADVGPPDTSIS